MVERILCQFIVIFFPLLCFAHRDDYIVSTKGGLEVGQIIDLFSLKEKQFCNSAAIRNQSVQNWGEGQFAEALTSEEVSKRTFSRGEWLNINWIRDPIFFIPEYDREQSESLNYLAEVNGVKRYSLEPCRKLQPGEGFVRSAQQRAFYLFSIVLDFESKYLKERWVNKEGIKKTNLFSIWNELQTIPEKFKFKIHISQVGGLFPQMNSHFLKVLPLIEECEQYKWKKCFALTQDVYMYNFGLDGLPNQLRQLSDDPLSYVSDSSLYEVNQGSSIIQNGELLKQKSVQVLADLRKEELQKLEVLKSFYKENIITYEKYNSLKEYIDENSRIIGLNLESCFDNWVACSLDIDVMKRKLHRTPNIGSLTNSFVGICLNRNLTSIENQKLISELFEIKGSKNCEDLNASLNSRRYLDLSYRAIRSIDLLKYFPHLARINLSGNSISDFQVLSVLKNLKIIEIRKTPHITEAFLRRLNDGLELIIL